MKHDDSIDIAVLKTDISYIKKAIDELTEKVDEMNEKYNEVVALKGTVGRLTVFQAALTSILSAIAAYLGIQSK